MDSYDHCPKCGWHHEITNENVTEVYGTSGEYLIIKHQKCLLCKCSFNIVVKRRLNIDNL